MMNTIKALFSAFFLILAFVVQGQSISGSAYNVFGIGSLEHTGLVSFEGMGNIGIANRSTENVNLKNPAALNAIHGYNQIFDVGFTYSLLNQSSEGQSFNTSSGGINGLNYWFRNSSKMAMTFGFSKISDASYDVTDQNAENNVLGNYDARHLGEGGTTSFYFGTGYELTERLNVGARFNFLFGSMNHTESFYSPELSTYLEVEEDKWFTSALFDFGAQYIIPFGKKTIILGATLSNGTSAGVAYETIIESSTDTLNYTGASSAIKIPPKYGLGVGVNNGSWSINLDYEYQPWGMNTNGNDYSYRDRTILSAGIEFQKDRTSQEYLDRMSYRIGTSTFNNYISIEGINYWNSSFSAGLGLPIGMRGLINLSYQYVNNGTLSNGLIYEQQHSFSIGLSFKDIWFRKSVYD
ncbi:hypothetical protein AAOE16_02965 [Ekhidna sp. MALMAid0563]